MRLTTHYGGGITAPIGGWFCAPTDMEFSVLTKTKDVQVERHQAVADSRSIERTRRIVDRVWRAIEDEHFYPAPSPMNCGSCPFRKPCRKWPG